MFGFSKKFFKPGYYHFFFGFALLLVFFLGEFMGIPDVKDTINWFDNLYEKNSFLLLFFFGFFEGLFLVSVYFPGSLFVLLSVVSESESVLGLIKVILMVNVGFLTSNIINFYIGKKGLYIFFGRKIFKNYPLSINDFSFRTLLVNAVHPTFITFKLINAGIRHKNPLNILVKSFVVQLIWSVIWCFAILVSKPVIENLKNNSNTIAIIPIIIILWGVYDCYKVWKGSAKLKKSKEATRTGD